MSSITIAANERAFNDLIIAGAKKLASTPPLTGNGSLGPFSASYQIGFKITDGSVDLTNNNTVHIKELDITYDPLVLTLGIDLPHIHIGGECILWVPFAGCIVRLPEIDIWGSNPDITIPIDLSGLVVSEFSGEFSVSTNHQSLAAKGSLSDHQAHVTHDTSNELRDRFRTIIHSALPILPSSAVNAIADALVPYVKGTLADKWQFFLHDVWHDLDLIDIADTARNILTHLVDFIIDKILAPVPDLLKDIVKGIIHPIIDLMSDILDIGDDVLEWLSSVFSTSFGLFDILAQFIINFIGSMIPFYQFEDPYPIIEDGSGLIPVLIPVDKVGVSVTDEEFIITTDIH